MSASFDARALERSYAFLDDCPSELLPQIVTLPIGTVAERVAGIRAWRRALLDGTVPRDAWPSGRIGQAIAVGILDLGLARFCKDQSELVDEILRDIVDAATRQRSVLESEIVERLRQLEELERDRRRQAIDAKRRTPSHARIELDDATIRRLLQQARADTERHRPTADEGLVSAWAERARAWAEISEVFGDLGRLLGRGWDLSLGILRHTGWLDVLRLSALIEKLPQIQQIVRSLGRLQDTHDGSPIAERVFGPVRRLEEERKEVWTPSIPAETRGVERGSSLSRMLPAEAAMLGHPKLRMLWHARRAERALLLYRVEGVEIETTLREVESTEEIEGKRPRPERGPIIAVIDTSGSMHGIPERIAKALVLQALRTAYEERRRCFVFAYSGPGQILEHELELSTEGLGRFLAFLGMSFGGGNDETAVLLRVVDRLSTEGWRKADIIFVSDGEWPVPTGALARIELAREVGTRFCGVQIGNRGRTGLHAVCEPVHVFREWAELGAARPQSDP